ncbi:MAG TPA: histidine kinase [Thiobacillaceae bacterium]
MSLEEASLSTNPFRPLDLPDQKAIGEIRLILALAALIAVVLMPSFTGLPVRVSYGVIAAYIASALMLYWAALTRPARVRQRLIYWLDAGWLLAFIGFAGSQGGSPLFLLLLFPILVAAAQAGFLQGMIVSVGTTLAYVVLEAFLLAGTLPGPELALHAGILLVLGFMVARWAGSETHLKRKLATLSRLGKLTRVHEELDPFWNDSLRELAAYFGAESAFFLGRGEDGGYRLYQYEAGGAAWSMALDEEQAAALAGVPDRWVIAWRALLRGPRFGCAQVVDMFDGLPLKGMEGRLRPLARTLDARRWLSFPLHAGGGYRGRIFLVGVALSRSRLDPGFIQQLAGQIGLEWDSLLMARQLTRVAASGERERISRDLHDSTVQPYLGLKYGLEALRRRVPADDALSAEVDELVRMTDASILQLRGYIRDLRSVDRGGTQPALTAILAQVQQFEDYSGLKVDVRAREFTLSEARLFEVRQLIAEGLSNIRRHTGARRATLEIVVEHNTLRIAFINPAARIAAPFKPRSLTERAAAMGGGVEVMRLATETVVKIALPLWMEGRT